MARHQVRRVRHETRRRTLTVETVTRLTPNMLRIAFRADDLHDLVSLSADDHVKLFLPAGDGSTCMRDYTPRRHDAVEGTLTIDFALHGLRPGSEGEAGVATQWAMGARAGDTLEIGGPRGSAVIPADFDWYWLIGDETALPAIGRWLEEAPADIPVATVVVVADEADRQRVRTAAAWTPIWVSRRDAGADDAASLRAALDRLEMPPGDGLAWIAAEAGVARALRDHVRDGRGHPREWIRAGGYWVRGEADAHDRLED